MGAYQGRIFKSGNSAAVRLPKDVAFELDTEVVIERVGDVVTIRPAVDADAERRKVEAFVARRLARKPIGVIGERLPFDWPTRAE